MAKQMVTIRLNPKEATLNEVKRQLGLSDNEIDQGFGIVSIDPAAHTYAVLVEGSAATRVTRSPNVSGPFSNPRIDTFD